MGDYLENTKNLFDKIVSKNKKVFQEVSQLFCEAIVKDKIIHTFGTGHSHMIGLELFVRASGLANVNAFLDSIVMTSEGARRSAEIERIEGISKIIWEQHKIQKNDLFLVISNSGRNAMPVEMAMLAKEKGLKVIAITSLEQSQKYPSRHSTGKQLYEIADCVIDNCVPSGDGMMKLEGYQIGPSSTLSGTFIVNYLVTKAIELAIKKTKKLPIYFSQNIDGYSNEELYQKYKDRIKHL